MYTLKLTQVVTFEKEEGELVALLNNDRSWGGSALDPLTGPTFFTSMDGNELCLLAWKEPPFSWVLGLIETDVDAPWRPTEEELNAAKTLGTGDFVLPECVNLIQSSEEVVEGQEVFIPSGFFSPDTCFGYNKKEDTYYYVMNSCKPDLAIHLGKGLYLLMEEKNVVGVVLTRAKEAYDNAGEPIDLTV